MGCAAFFSWQLTRTSKATEDQPTHLSFCLIYSFRITSFLKYANPWVSLHSMGVTQAWTKERKEISQNPSWRLWWMKWSRGGRFSLVPCQQGSIWREQEMSGSVCVKTATTVVATSASINSYSAPVMSHCRATAWERRVYCGLEAVNAVGSEQRTHTQVKKKWSDLKVEVKWRV